MKFYLVLIRTKKSRARKSFGFFLYYKYLSSAVVKLLI